MRLLLAALLPLALLLPPVAAARPADELRGQQGLRRERRVVDLLNRAVRATYAAAPSCQPARPSPTPSFTDEPPSAELLATLGVLRRPARAVEQALSPEDLGWLPAEGIYRAHLRIARSASGRRFLVVAARNTRFSAPRPQRCVDALRRRAARLVAREPGDVRRELRRVLAQVIRDEWAGPPTGPQEGVFLFDYGPGGSGGGGVGVQYLRERGMFGSSGRGRPGAGDRAVVSGLLPDGVATVTATFARVVSRGRYRPPRRYPTTVRRTVQVRDNVVAFTVPRPAPDAFPTRMVWRAADGAVVRVVGERE